MILGIYGHSDSGKTDLVEKLTRTLSKKYRVAVIKHICKPDFSVDTPGKDTYRHAKAGAFLVVAASEGETAYILKRGEMLAEMTKQIESYSPDIILVEGFKRADIPKVSVGRIKREKNTVVRYRAETDFKKILAYIERELRIEKNLAKLPMLDCKKCCHTCREFAALILKKKKTFEDCPYFSEKEVSVTVNGKTIPLGRFAKEIVSQTLTGMISSLKGVEEIKSIEIKIDLGS